ncbi:MAG: flagellar hook-associated protein FlgK [Clostridiales bacterium]
MAIDAFFGLSQASSGLRAAQKNLSIVSHNLSNASTEGYSRQQSIQEAGKTSSNHTGAGIVGTGTEIITIERIRDDYLDFKFWSEEITQGEWQAKSLVLADIEVVFNEPSDSGFNTTMNDFYEGLQELAKDPSSDSVRAIVRQKSVTLTKYFNTTAAHLEKIQEDINHNIKAKVEEVNSLAKQLAEVNKQIFNQELSGHSANDLRDRRVSLVDKVAKLINVEAKELIQNSSSGVLKKEFMLTISGKPLVDNFEVTELSMDIRQEKLNEEDTSGLYEISWSDGNSIEIRGGEIKGYLDSRDGNEAKNDSPNYKGIPFYISKLNKFVRTFSMNLNEGYVDQNNDGTIQINEDGVGHVDGYKRNSSEDDQPSGIRFFTHMDADGNNITTEDFLDGAGDVENDPATLVNERIEAIYERYNNITARNFAISQDLFDSYDNISVSDKPAENGNMNILNDILSARHNKELFAEGASEDFLKSLISTMGIDTQQANRITENQDNIVKQISNRRLSNSGVSIDEEMSNLVKFQHTYNASAKMISTMSELYDTLINRTGV